MPPILIVPIAPSGSGKSTLYSQLLTVNPKLYCFSWDLLRLKYYSPDYGIAWLMYQRDPTFFSRAFAEYKTAIIRRDDIYVDNMNLTVESRHQFIKLASQYGYKRIAYYFNVSFDELFKRHSLTRSKNKVRLSTFEIQTQLAKQTYPTMSLDRKGGEFNEQVILDWDKELNNYAVRTI